MIAAGTSDELDAEGHAVVGGARRQRDRGLTRDVERCGVRSDDRRRPERAFTVEARESADLRREDRRGRRDPDVEAAEAAEDALMAETASRLRELQLEF